MISDKDDSLRDITSGSDSLLESLEKLDLRQEKTGKQGSTPPEKPLFRNIRSGTPSRLWQGVNWQYMQFGLIGLFTYYVGVGIRGDGWGLAVSTLFVAAASIWLLPSSINKKRRPPKACFRWSPRSRENPTLNIIAYFFVASYALTTIIAFASNSSGGRVHFSYTVLPLALAMPAAIAYWNSSNSSLIKKSVGSMCCPAVAFGSVLLFYIGAEGSGRMQNLQGLSHYRDGNFKESLEPYTKAISINPQDPVYLVNRGWSHHYLKNESKSILDAQNALKIDPKNANALKLLEVVRKGEG